MIAEILSVGTELLLGQIANTDAQYLAQRLSELGISAYYQMTVGDNMGRLVGCIEQALGRSDILITTGGLGPTQDDLTKEGVAAFLGVPMVKDDAAEAVLRAHFAGRGWDMTPNNLRQVWFPQGSVVIPNDYGTAPGCRIDWNGKVIIVLPGPPSELRGMFGDQVMPFLQARSGEAIHSKVLRVFGMGESSVEHALRDLIEEQTNPTIAPYASFGEMSLRLTVQCGKGEDPEPLLAPLEAKVRARIGEFIYSDDGSELHESVVQLLLRRGKTVSTAESCTGGLIASMLVAVPGVSEALNEGYVTYANEAKHRLLGVPEEMLAEYGAVSEPVARAMAEGARRASGADFGLATTGIAGPGGGSPEKPVGLVYVALAHEGGTEVKELRLGHRASRERIRRMSALNALDMLRRALL